MKEKIATLILMNARSNLAKMVAHVSTMFQDMNVIVEKVSKENIVKSTLMIAGRNLKVQSIA